MLYFSNGVGRTGAFTTIYSQIERIKAEQVADIFQYIKASRIQRAEMVIEEVRQLRAKQESWSKQQLPVGNTLGIFLSWPLRK